MKRVKDLLPPELCIIPNEDKAVFEGMSKEALSVMYVGTARSGEDYKDIYIIITTSMIPYVLSVRRICPSKKATEEALATEVPATSVE